MIKKTAKQQGFSMIEVLVAAIILGVGMLGILTLQTKSLQYNHQAYLRSQALFLMQDIADRMRNNVDQADSYQVEYSETPTAGTNCFTATCTSAEIADWDVSNWKADVAAILPAGNAEITKDGNDFIIEVQFNDSRIDTDPDTDGIQSDEEQYNIVVQL